MAEVAAKSAGEVSRALRRTAALRIDTSDRVLIAVALALFALRLVIAGNTGLVDDEAYYRIWSLAPALSYFDHPPMVAWIIAAGRAIAGDTVIGVRLLAPASLLLGAVLLWRTASLLYGTGTARRAVWLMLAMPLLAVGGIIVTPDVPSVLFSGMVLWGLAELDRSQNANWWLAIGLLAGLGLLSKYTNLFLGATIVIWLFAVPANSRWLRTPQPWIGALLAVSLASPVVIWNAEHGWASFAKQFGRVTHSGSAGSAYMFEMAGTFLGLASPLIAILAIAGLAQITRRAFASRKSADVLLTASVLPMLLYFIAHALHDRVQGNWLAPLYPPLAICAAVGLDAIVPERRRQAVFVIAIVLGFLVTVVIYAHALSPIQAVAVHKDPTEQMRGWSALADAIDEKRREAGAAWVATSSYATTGQLAFALKDRSEVVQLDERLRYIFLPALPQFLLAKPALYVELDRRVDLPLLRAKFRSVVPVGSLIRANGSDGATYRLFLLSDPWRSPI
jgi:4-amino-4-deoxy-L-arabinose transferase-like glycosyltransferase